MGKLLGVFLVYSVVLISSTTSLIWNPTKMLLVIINIIHCMYVCSSSIAVITVTGDPEGTFSIGSQQ